MIYDNDLKFSRLGMGFMRHDVNDFHKTQELVDYAMSHGINYFEACTFYLQHQCESIVAKALAKYPREKYYICDKYDIFGSHLPVEKLEDFFNHQLQICGVEYFDVYLIQALDRRSMHILQSTYDFFLKKKQEGKIKMFGFSFHDTKDILQYYLDNFIWDCCQIQLNYYDWYLGEGKALYELLEQKNIPIMVMGPFKGGTLTVRQPQILKQYYGMPYLSHLAMHFLQTLPQVKVILTGAEHIPMLQENIALIDNYTFTLQDKENCQFIMDAYKKRNVINCTGCGYCTTVCPKQIKIPQLLEYYNRLLLNPKDAEIRNKFAQLSKSQFSFFECIHCGQCEKRCPQHLPISDYCYNQLFTARL